MIRVGVIGLRFGAQVHVPAFRADGRCEVTALAGRDRARSEAAADALGISRGYESWRTLLAEAPIDALSIAVPPADQAAIIGEAARLGKHIFCEKPLAESLTSAEHALESVRRSGVVHAIDFIFPEIPEWQLTRTLLREGAIGAVRHFAYTWKLETYVSRVKAKSWKNAPGEGGGVVLNFLSHALYNVEWLLGEITGIDRLPDRREAPGSFCDCVAHLAGGLHGSLSVSTDAFLGDGHRIEVFGESGTLVLWNKTADYASGFEVSVGTRQSNRLEVVSPCHPSPGVDGRITAVGSIVRRFLDGIEGGCRVAPNLEDGIRVQRWLERLNHT